VRACEVINAELEAFSVALMEKPMIVVATKLDATTDRTRLEELREFCKQKGLEFHAISGVTGDGVKELMKAMADALDKIPREAAGEPSREGEQPPSKDSGAVETEQDQEEDEDGPSLVKKS
jgi:GTPase involved in cell partitioning and DNA repair